MRKTGASSEGGRGGRLQSESGVGLTETLVSLVIFSAAMLGIVGTSARVGMTVNSTHGRLSALSVARQQLEEVMAEEYASVAGGTATRAGVELKWAVQEADPGKNIVVVYRYTVPGAVREDTLVAGLRRP